MSGFSITASIRDEALRAALKAADKASKKDARLATKRAVDEVMTPRVRASVPSRSGAYKASIRSGATARSAYVQARTPYAKVLERGRPAMRITVKNAKALSTPAGPRRSVQSPRYPARNTMRKAATPHVAETARRVETYLSQALRRHLS